MPGTELNVDGESESISRVLNLAEYLPDGTRLVVEDEDEFDGNVSVTVNIEELVAKTYNIPIRNLSLQDVPEGYEAEILLLAGEDEDGTNRTAHLPVTLKGVEEDFENITGNDLHGHINVQAYLQANHIETPAEGLYQMTIELVLPEGLESDEIYYADIRLKLKTGGQN